MQTDHEELARLNAAAEAIFHAAGGSGWARANQDYYRKMAKAADRALKEANNG